jgi:RND family efflux transporter MFP subunit
MSKSMWAWRVIVPGLGLLACSLVFSDSSRLASKAAAAWAGATSGTVAVPTVDLAPKPARAIGVRVVAEGRVVARPGAEVTVGTEAGGIVVGVPLAEKTRVKKGDLLVEFLADDQRAALLDAEAKLAEAEAEFAYQNGEFQRRSKAKTEAKQFVAELEGTRRDLAVADARRRSANAAIARCRSGLARTKVVSPIDGVILARFVEPGEVAAPGARLVTVCDLTRLRIEAEVDEFDAARVAPGDLAIITVEGLDGSWPGTVEEVPDRVADRALRPDDPGRPSDTSVLRVKVAPEAPLPLKLGQQVEVEIRKRPSPAL